MGEIAEVIVNGQNVGTRWMRDTTLEITEYIQKNNKMIVLVTNTNINRVSGWTEPPPVPKELVPRFGKSASNRAPEMDFEALPASGLLGPVRIVPFKKVKIPIQE